MVKSIQLPLQQVRLFDKKSQKKILEYAGKKIKEMYSDILTNIYKINMYKRTAGNYIPLEEILESIDVKYDYQNVSLSIFINEDKIKWRDENGEPIHKVAMWIDEPSESDWKAIKKEQQDIEGQYVTSLEDYWKTPIRNTQEEELAIEFLYNNIELFVKGDFAQYLQKIIKSEGKL